MKKAILIVLSVIHLFALVACSFNAPFDITMPYSSLEYISGDWTVEELVAHFEDLGFHNIETVEHLSYFGDYINEIVSVQIEAPSDSLFTEYASFEKGDVVNSIDKVYICYYRIPDALSAESCPDFAAILFGAENGEPVDYMAFAEKYDGQYVRFNAYVYYHTTFNGGSSHIIDVVGGDNALAEPVGCIIRIGNQSWGNQVDESVEEGQLVRVYGKIDARKSQYYQQLYIEALALETR